MLILQAATQIEDFPSNISISLIYYLTTWTIQIFISKGGHFLIGVVSPFSLHCLTHQEKSKLSSSYFLPPSSLFQVWFWDLMFIEFF